MNLITTLRTAPEPAGESCTQEYALLAKQGISAWNQVNAGYFMPFRINPDKAEAVREQLDNEVVPTEEMLIVTVNPAGQCRAHGQPGGRVMERI